MKETLRMNRHDVGVAVKKGSMELVESFTYAKRIFGRDFLGPEAIQKAFGIEMKPPPIPFSQEAMEEAKEMGMFLIFRTNGARSETPLTMSHMSQIGRVPLFPPGGKYMKEPFFTMFTAEPRWALVTKTVIPESIDRNYLQQTRAIVQFVQFCTNVKHYQQAINEYYISEQSIDFLLHFAASEAEHKLTNLSINTLTRRKAVEIAYDTFVYFLNNGVYLLNNTKDWSLTRTSSGNIAFLGQFDQLGMEIQADPANANHRSLGAVISLSI